MNGLRVVILAQRLRDALFTWFVRGGFAHVGRGSRILLPFRTGNSQHISIGRRVLIGPQSWLLVPVADASGTVLEIGDRVRMNQTSISAVSSVVIEEGVELARGVYISDHSHGFTDADTPIRDQPLIRTEPVRIGRGAWLGQNVVVLPGVTIGAGSVIGANSVVTHDVPPRCIAAGVPARVLRNLDP